MARPPWRAASACEIGTSHQATGAPCQDSIACRIVRTKDGPVFVSAVSDGAGSAKHSDIGSWLATSHFIELIEFYLDAGRHVANIDRDQIVDWMSQTAQKLTDRAREDGNDPKGYSCTLLVSIVGHDVAVFAQVGDGAIVVSHGEADGWSWVFWPQRGQYANQTTFILSDNAMDVLEFNLAPRRIDELAMFSDGIERMVLHAASMTVNDAFFDQMLVPVRASKVRGVDQSLSEKLKLYLSSPAVNARTNDDKSLILATRRPRTKLPAK